MLHEEELEIATPPHMSDAEFFRFCRDNDELRIERDHQGYITIMPPTGFKTGTTNTDLTTELNLWNRRARTGLVGDSSTGYRLPDLTVRSPDASWISNERLAQTTPEEQEEFLPAVPEFVVEIRSRSDRPRTLREKMEDYLANGVLLGWYIDRPGQLVEIYRAGKSVETVEGFERLLSGEEVLPGFEFDLAWMK